MQNIEFKPENSNLDYFIQKIKNELEEYEYSSFLLGCTWPPIFSEEEKNQRKKEFQYKLVKKIEKELNVKSNFEEYDVSITVDFRKQKIHYWIRPVYVEARYNKYSREISQTKQHVKNSKGFSKRKETKLKVEHSIESLIEPYFLKAFVGKEFKFHGAGREDIDVLMLGIGRPFIAEIISPKKRTCDLLELENRINSKEKDVKINSLKFAEKKRIPVLKAFAYGKIYLAITNCKGTLDNELVEKLKGKTLEIKQKTPIRVMHRRADIERKRNVTIEDIKLLDSGNLEITIKADAGLYIKEFISSDKKRTHPSIAEFLKCDCKCVQLDVLEIIEN